MNPCSKRKKKASSVVPFSRSGSEAQRGLRNLSKATQSLNRGLGWDLNLELLVLLVSSSQRGREK